MHSLSTQAAPFGDDVYAYGGYGSAARSQDAAAPQPLAFSPPSSSSSSNATPVNPPAQLPSVKAGASKQKHIPRPPNSFMIFRSRFAKGVKARRMDTHQTNVSRDAGAAWKALSDEEKLVYRLQANIEKFKHSEKFPNYSYTPKRSAKRSAKPYPAPSRNTLEGPRTQEAAIPQCVSPFVPMPQPTERYLFCPTLYSNPLEQTFANYMTENSVDNNVYNSVDYLPQDFYWPLLGPLGSGWDTTTPIVPELSAPFYNVGNDTTYSAY